MKFKNIIICLFFGIFSFKCAASKIALIYENPGPKQHFLEFKKVLNKNQRDAEVYSLAEWKKTDQKSPIVITEGGDSRFALLHEALEKKGVIHFVYYDNPESYVPGGYSFAMSVVLKEKNHGILFANRHLAKSVSFSNHNCFPIGYYPLSLSRELLELKKEKEMLRKSLLAEMHTKDTGQILTVFLGAANEEYNHIVFPHLLKAIQELPENFFLVLKPHPRSLVEKETFVVTEKSFVEMLAVADLVLYFQSSAAAQCLLAEIPLIQFAPTPSLDFLVKESLVTSISSFKNVEFKLNEKCDREKVLDGLGYDPNWENNLINVIEQAEQQSQRASFGETCQKAAPSQCSK